MLVVADFRRLDQPLFTRTFLSAGMVGNIQRGAPSLQAEGREKPALKSRKLAACFAWNDGKACVSTPCRFSHICARCGSDHKKSACPAVKESPAAEPGTS